MEQMKKDKNKKKKVLLIVAIIAFILLVVSGSIAIYMIEAKKQEARETASLQKEQKEKEMQKEVDEETKELEDGLFGFSIESGINVFDSIRKRPPSVEVDEEQANEFLQIESCRIHPEISKVILKFNIDTLPLSDDKYYYLFNIKSFQDNIDEDKQPLQKEYKDTEVEFKFPRHFTGTESGVFQKFVVAIKKDGKYVIVSKPHYITNPEAVSKYKHNGEKASSKKGLLVDPNKLRTPELDDLGVKHAAYNIPVSRILGQSNSEIYPTINYTYNGKNYAFNGQVMSEYDLVFSILTNKGIEVTAIILNDISASYPQLIHPLSRSGLGSAPYYAFNGTNEAGVEYIAAVGAFLAERYSGTANGRGLVSNWVIGNEINARKEWNYMEYVSLEAYVREYAKAFRIFYNAIKSINAASNIYISLDQQWDRNIINSKNYDSRDILDEFNRQIKAEGNIDWGLAIHPYNVPLTIPQIWVASKYVKNTADTSMVTMANINVVTDYLEKKEFLTDSGEVRSVTLSEIGYTSQRGEELQAAALVYAYKVAEANPHVDAILFSRQTDAIEEMVDGLSFGLNHPDGTHKYAYNTYKYMDTENQETYTNFAKGIIGISDWSQILK